MAGWAKRFGSWASGQTSPFTGPSRSESDDNTVKDSDFAYITEEDIKKQEEHAHHHHHHRSDRPSRETDQLIFRYRNKQQTLHFAPWSISDGKATVGTAKEHIARRLEVNDPRRIRLVFKGRNLKDDSMTLYDAGMDSEKTAEVLCMVGDAANENGEGEDSASDEEADDAENSEAVTSDTKTTKKKRKSKKKKGRKSAANSSAPGIAYTGGAAGAEHLPIPAGLHPFHRDSDDSSTPVRGASPAPKAPQTALGKLQALEDKYKNDLEPGAEAFVANPPADQAKRAFEGKKFSETIMTQVLLKLDGVEVEGDDEARAKRKALVKETQAMLNRLDAAAK